MANLDNMFNTLKNTICTKFAANPAKMLIYTGVIGWFLSAAAQVGAVAFNSKIPKEQKAYLIPQEIGDGAVNILSFLLLTTSVKTLASKLVSTGKLVNPEIKTFLEKAGIKESIGNIKFNIEKMPNFDKIKSEYLPFKKGVDVWAMTLGSILSCNIVTPILRNKYATNVQTKKLAQMHDTSKMRSPRGITMDDYIRNARINYSNGLKI